MAVWAQTPATRADALGRGSAKDAHVGIIGNKGDLGTTDKTKPRVLHQQYTRWPVFWLAFILSCPAFPCNCTVAYGQNRQAYSSGGCAGLSENYPLVTGFPFHPPADKLEDTIA